MTQQLYEQWFRIADVDKDGAIAGAEAVSFFTRSGLPQLALGQIWEMASGGSAKLNQFQFSSAMRLVALAQTHGGQLPLDQARAIVAGVGPSLPPPTMQGLEGGGVVATAAARPTMTQQGATAGPGALPAYAAQATGAATGAVAPHPYGAQATGAAPLPYSAQGTGAMPYTAQSTGVVATSPYVLQPTGGAVPGYPPLPVSELQRYQASFAHLDSDKDGYVTGAECFTFFTQFNLDKAVLRDIWNLVAGAEGRLSVTQFVAYLYLMECCKRGLPLPPQLPPGLAGFLPVVPPGAALQAPAAVPPAPAAAPAPAATWSLQSQFGTSSNITAVLASPPLTSSAAPPVPPAMPTRLDLTTGERLAAPAAAQPSRVPAVSAALLAGVSAMDRTKLQDEQQVCEAKEKALQSAEERAAEARARQAALTTALQELVVFRNRTEVALLTCQDTARRLEEEVEAARKRYEAGYAAAQVASEKSAALHTHIMELMTQKSELEEKLRRLESEVAAAERMAPADVARLEAELAELQSRCTALEAARNAKMAKVDGIRRAQEAARSQLAALKESERDTAAELEGCQSTLEQLEGQLKDARQSGVLTALPSLLARAATLYRGLYGMVQRAGTAVPFEALPATLTGLHVWSDEVAAGVLDWPDDDVHARGYVIVNALPGSDAPRPITKPTPAPAPIPASPAPPATSLPPALPRQSSSIAQPPPKQLPDVFVSLVSPTESFNDPPAFDDPPAFGSVGGSSGSSLMDPHAPVMPLPSVPSNAIPLLPARAANASVTFYGTSSTTFGSGAVDFGFEDPPAFGTAVVAAPSSAAAAAPPPVGVPPPLPVAATPGGGLLGLEASLSTGTLGAIPGGSTPSLPPRPSHAQDFGSGFSFGHEDSATFLDNPTPSASLSVPMSHASKPPAAAFVADFGNDAFGDVAAAAPFPAATLTATTTGAAGGSTAGSFRRGGSAASSGFGDAPAFGAAPDPFGGSAFAAPGFPRVSSGSGTGFSAAGLPAGGGGSSGNMMATTTQPISGAADAPPPLLPGGDSGALEENPFAKPQAPPFMLPSLSITSGGSGGSTAAGGVGQVAATRGSGVELLTGAEGGETTGWKAAGSGPVAAATASTDFGFGDDNPFGDNDNPFGSPAFPQR